MRAFVLLLTHCVVAMPPPCLDKSQRVAQVNSLSHDSTIRAGFNTFAQAGALARYLYTQGVSPSPTPTAWLGVGYPNGKFISIEDCSVQENWDLWRCKRPSTGPYFVVQLLSPAILPGSDWVHAWMFSTAGHIVGNESDYIDTRSGDYIVTDRPWWGVSGWSELYEMQNGNDGRTYGASNSDYTIASVFAMSEGVCPDGIDDYTDSLSGGQLAGIVVGVVISILCFACCTFIWRKPSSPAASHRGDFTAAQNRQNLQLELDSLPPPTYAETPGYTQTYNQIYSKEEADIQEIKAKNKTGRSASVGSIAYPSYSASTVATPPPNAAPASYVAQLGPISYPGEKPEPATPPPSVYSANYLSNLGPVKFPESDYAEQLDGTSNAVNGVPAGLQTTLAFQPASPTPGFTENYMENLAPVSFPESDYPEQLSSSSTYDPGYQAPSYSSYDASAPPPTYY